LFEILDLFFGLTFIKGSENSQVNDLSGIALREEYFVSDKIDMHKVKELKEMLEQKPLSEPVEKVLTVFCERHSISMGTCRVLYNQLVEDGKINK